MTERASALVTILFTDLVGSTELLSRAGVEDARQVFRAHHDLLTKAAAVHGGEEVKWLGDGLMVAFPSAFDALRCAVAMQEESRRPIHGERLAIRVGLNAGETIRDESDYFGLPVVIARRLCDRADGGQILCTEVVVGLLPGGRAGFAFSDLGKLELKGVPDAVGAFEVRYEVEPGAGLPSRTHFVGRQAELRRLVGRLGQAAAGQGGLVVVAGEPGIGKTRLTEELAERARRDGVLVLWGHCLEGEWAPPYAPFAEALDAQVGASEPDQLRADLGPGAGSLAQLIPRIRQVLPDVPDPAPVQPDEERFRLLDAAAQLLVARGRRSPVLVCLEDLHWADRGTVAMLRHIARSAPHSRVLVYGTFRDAEVGPDHPLSDALASLRREVEYERIDLAGLATQEVEELIASFAEHEVSRGFVSAVTEETEGNPFFIRELISYFTEVGTLYRGPDGRWTSGRPIRELGIPEGVREVIGRRIARLSEGTRRLLAVGAALEGPFRFDVVRSVADLDENTALDAIDEALAFQVLRDADTDSYTFAHALIRTTLYGALSTSRQVRLHSRVAEALEAAYGKKPSPAQAGEIAAQYHRSAALSGAERGAEFALLAASHAESTGAHEGGARFLRIALDLLPKDDPRRPRLLGRLGIALVWALAFDEAAEMAAEASRALAETEGAEAAATYLADAAYAFGVSGAVTHAWALAPQGLDYTEGRRDVAWARLLSFDSQRREFENPEFPGVPIDTPERREASVLLRAAQLDPVAPAPMECVFESREEVLTSTNLVVLAGLGSEYSMCLPLARQEVERAMAAGQFARAARAGAVVVFCHAGLGQIDEARTALQEAQALAARVGQPMFLVLNAQEALCGVLDEGWDDLAPIYGAISATVNPAYAWGLGFIYSNAARIAAYRNRAEEALGFLDRAVPWLERAPGWSMGFNSLACDAAEVLWRLESTRHIALIERSLREKVLAPDFRYVTREARLALARLCALQGRHDEALGWFRKARQVLSEQGARPLLAIADFDEALMYLRRGGPGDAERADPLLEAAQRQFEAIGMTGWIARAKGLSKRPG